MFTRSKKRARDLEELEENQQMNVNSQTENENKIEPEFITFRSNEKEPFQTRKTTLKHVLRNYKRMQLVVNKLVLGVNDLMIHSYQFIRLYILYCYKMKHPFPEIN